MVICNYLAIRADITVENCQEVEGRVGFEKGNVLLELIFVLYKLVTNVNTDVADILIDNFHELGWCWRDGLYNCLIILFVMIIGMQLLIVEDEHDDDEC